MLGMCPDQTRAAKRSFVLACRHHIFELLAQTAFSTTMGSTAAPEVLLFKRFQARWKFIEKTLFATGPRQLTADNADWLKRAILNIFLLSPEPSCLNPHFVTKSLRRNQ